MRIGLRLLLGFFLIAGIAAFFVLRVFVQEVRPSVREVMEDMLIDTANLLAELAVDDLAAMPEGGSLAQSRFAQRVEDYARRPIDAKIWGLNKQSLDYRVYVTDASGRVVFDTGFRERVSDLGADYSRWNDVARTLSGQYGARATRESPRDDGSSALYVAAPVRQGERVLGVLTVAKPTRTVQQFVDRAERDILIKGLWLLGLSLAVGLVVTAWVVLSVRRLRHYALQVQHGQRQAAPQLSGELGELARAMETMQDRLEGRAYTEQLVRALTHELKSPLTAIRGAAELLHEDLPTDDRRGFALQIQEQSTRMTQLITRLLELLKLEMRQRLAELRPVDLQEVLRVVMTAAAHRAEQRQVNLHLLSAGPAQVQGEPELLQLALSNLLENALDHAPRGSSIRMALQLEPGWVLLTLRDEGPGVPEDLLPRLGQRFYATAHADDREGALRKGSGLGLAIVHQVLQLHGGRWQARNAQPGLELQVRWPRP